MKYSEIKYVDKKVSRIFFDTAGDSFWKGENCDDLLDGRAEN